MTLKWEDYIRSEEAAEAGRCYGVALSNGHSIAQADECDDGSLKCSDCPWALPEVSLEE